MKGNQKGKKKITRGVARCENELGRAFENRKTSQLQKQPITLHGSIRQRASPEMSPHEEPCRWPVPVLPYCVPPAFLERDKLGEVKSLPAILFPTHGIISRHVDHLELCAIRAERCVNNLRRTSRGEEGGSAAFSPPFPVSPPKRTNTVPNRLPAAEQPP